MLQGHTWLAASLVVDGNLGAICAILAWRTPGSRRTRRRATRGAPVQTIHETIRIRRRQPAPALPPAMVEGLDGLALFLAVLATCGSLLDRIPALWALAIMACSWQVLIVRLVLSPAAGPTTATFGHPNHRLAEAS